MIPAARVRLHGWALWRRRAARELAWALAYGAVASLSISFGSSCGRALRENDEIAEAKIIAAQHRAIEVLLDRIDAEIKARAPAARGGR